MHAVRGVSSYKSPTLMPSTHHASPVLKNSEALYQHVVRGDYWVPTNCILTVNGGVASLIAWLDHSCQKTEIGVSKGILPIEEFCSNKFP